MEAKEKAEELVDYFKTLVYPFIGSSMLTNDEDEGAILANSKTCALKVVDEIIGTIENIHKPEYVAFDIYEPRKFHLEGSESEDNLSGYEINEYWQKVKTEIENL